MRLRYRWACNASSSTSPRRRARASAKVAAALKEILDNEYGMQDHPPVIIRTVQNVARRLDLFEARETVAEKIGNNKLRGALVECEDTEAAVQRLARVLNERAAPNDYHPLETALKAIRADVEFVLFT